MGLYATRVGGTWFFPGLTPNEVLLPVEIEVNGPTDSPVLEDCCCGKCVRVWRSDWLDGIEVWDDPYVWEIVCERCPSDYVPEWLDPAGGCPDGVNTQIKTCPPGGDTCDAVEDCDPATEDPPATPTFSDPCP